MIATPDVANLRDELVDRQLRPVAGDRLELVERAPGMPEAAAAHLPDRHTARRDDRPDRERRLVADTSGRVLVDHLATQRGTEIDRVAAADHRVGQRKRLGRCQPDEVDGHAERRHLVVGHLAARVAEHEAGQLLRRELLAVTLALDELGRADHFVATKIEEAQWTTKGSPTSSGTGCVSTLSDSR